MKSSAVDVARIRLARACTNGSLNQRVLFGSVLVRVNIGAAAEGLADSASFLGENKQCSPRCHYPPVLKASFVALLEPAKIL